MFYQVRVCRGRDVAAVTVRGMIGARGVAPEGLSMYHVNAGDLPGNEVSRTFEGGRGDMVIGPAGVPHGFTNSGPSQARLVCIHAASEMTTEWVDRASQARRRPGRP